MGNVTTALIFVLTLNLLMAVSVVAMTQLWNVDNTDAPPSFCSNQGDLFYKNSNIVNNSNIENMIPGQAQATSPTTGNIFTDVFTSIRNWILGVPGLNYIYIIVSSPACAFQLLLPPELSPLFIGFWYMITLFLVIAFLWWRD